MPQIEQGQVVQVVDRTPTPLDTKSGLFYNHFRNLVGTVDRVYADGNLCIVVDHDSLTSELLFRLKRAERVIKPRWKTASGGGAPPEDVAPAATESAEGEVDGARGEITVADDEAIDGDIEAAVVAAGAGEEAPASEVLERLSSEESDGRVNPGLRYAIVVRPDDVVVIGRATSRSYDSNEAAYLARLRKS